MSTCEKRAADMRDAFRQREVQILLSQLRFTEEKSRFVQERAEKYRRERCEILGKLELLGWRELQEPERSGDKAYPLYKGGNSAAPEVGNPASTKVKSKALGRARKAVRSSSRTTGRSSAGRQALG